MNFPTIASPNFPIKRKREDISIASEFEDGSQQSRVRNTKSRRIFILKWNALSENDYITLENFIVHDAKFKANPFNWVDPLTGETVEVRVTDFPEWEEFSYKKWRGTLTLTEV